jgi:uncharacterized protein HemX/uroporphyrinogen-III synthase
MDNALRIVVTRPAGQNRALRDGLVAAGCAVAAIPVIEILPAAQPDEVARGLGPVGDIDLLIFVSTNAVRFGMDYLPADNPAAAVRGIIAAVGPSTARALTDAGLHCDVVPASGFSSEALLDEPALQDMAGKRVVIVRGEGGRALMGDTLSARGATVHYAEVYRRGVPAASVDALRAQLDTGAVDIITATSVETLVNIEQMAGPERADALHDARIVTASERVAKMARELGYTHDVLMAGAPDDDALIEAVVNWRQTRRPPATKSETQMATDSKQPDDNASPGGDQSTRGEEGAAVADTAPDTPPEDVTSSAPQAQAPLSAAEVAVNVKPAEPKKGGRLLAALALLIALGAAGLSGWTWWGSRSAEVEVEDPAIALNAVADRLRGELESVRDDVQRTATSLRSDVDRKLDKIDMSEVDDVADAQTALARRVSGQERSITTVTDRLGNIESSMSALQGVSDSVRNTWVRAEAEYFLQTANSRLQLAGDLASALSALRAADERIGALGDPGLIPVRAKITEEILAVEAVPMPDVEGMALSLLGMAERVPQLPLKLAQVPGDYEGTERGGGVDDKTGWDRARASISSAFSSIVRVTPTDGYGVSVAPPEEAFFLFRNLELNLNIARLALMRQDAENFRGSVTASRDWLAQYFNTDDPGVKRMIERLDELAATQIDPPIPDISASLRMLRALVAASSASP